MEIVKYNFKELKNMTILPIGDVHIGSKTSKWKELVNFALTHPKIYFLLLGDMINNSTKTSKVNPHDDIMSPSDQQIVLTDILKEIGPERFLGAVTGNHEERTTKVADIDPTETIYRALNIPFNRVSMVCDLTVGFKSSERGYNYSILFTHGKGGGRTPGAPVNNGSKTKNIINSGIDIYISGHTHQPFVVPKAVNEYDRHNKNIIKKTYWLVNAGAWLEYESYAERGLYEPNANIYNFIKLSGENKKIDFKMEEMKWN